MTDPHPRASASPDDDPTGVRALLFGLPEPEPMPDYLVARITASLAAAQAQRAAGLQGDKVAPLVAGPQHLRTRRRPARVLFAIAGVAATMALVAVLGGDLFKTTAPDSATSAAADLSSSPREVAGAQPPSVAPNKAAADRATSPPLIQIRESTTLYTQAGFATQARTLQDATFGPTPAGPTEARVTKPQGLNLVGKTAGLTACLRAVGVDGAQVVRADLALYDGAPAVIIVATTDGIPTAYALRRDCSPQDAAILHPGVALSP